jgi:multidrug efflux pump subunit AcrB
VTTLGALVEYETTTDRGLIRRHQLRRTITVLGDLTPGSTDTVQAARSLREGWEQVRAQYPGADLDFSGELEDIQESLSAMLPLLAMGLGLIYLILAAQFKSYWQPLLVMVTVPLVFTGVSLGLLVTGYPVSLYTLYGVIALTGITVNASIVLIDAANRRLSRGMGLLHATVYAARRRAIPVLMTSSTTVAGLISLALGIGGASLVWGPVASAIVFGLGFSTVLTLFVVPLLYRLVMVRSPRVVL